MARSDYIKKLDFIGGIDPYTLKTSDFDAHLDEIPKISKNVILDYFLFSLSPSTYFEIRAYKSLDAFAQLACKWIESICAKKLNNNFVIIGKVRHSQRVSEAALKPWVIVSEKGTILTGHCNCVAGLGEVCTHVASILFALDFAGNRTDEQSVTDVLAYWIGPSKKGQFYKKLMDIDFTMPNKLLTRVSEETAVLVPSRIPSLSKNEMDTFTQKMIDLGLMPAYAVPKCLPQILDDKFPKSLISLFDKKYAGLDLKELRDISKRYTMDVTKEQVLAVFEATIEQSESKLWFELRAGRITASKFKSACRTKIEKPAISLIKSICYPFEQKKNFKAGVYGCQHEKDALKAYIDEHRNNHENAHIEKCGLIIHVDYPFFGATPDGYLHCEECGTGCIEVKCPYCVRDVSVEEIVQFKSSCLVMENEDFVLDKKHSYYYQVQMQLAVSGKQFCDFVVWTPKNFICQRIQRDEDFWNNESEKAKKFFQEVLMPELLCHYYTDKNLNKAFVKDASKIDEKIPSTSFQECTMNEVAMPSTSFHDNQMPSTSIHDFQMPCTSFHEPTVNEETYLKEASPKETVSKIDKDEVPSTSFHERTTDDKTGPRLWCYCNTPDDGTKMINCQNASCRIQWFHRRCIEIKRLPKGKWFCKTCLGK